MVVGGPTSTERPNVDARLGIARLGIAWRGRTRGYQSMVRVFPIRQAPPLVNAGAIELL